MIRSAKTIDTETETETETMDTMDTEQWSHTYQQEGHACTKLLTPWKDFGYHWKDATIPLERMSPRAVE